MANKRTLKRAISQICDELFAECMAASLYGNDNSKDGATDLLFSIIKLESHYISRVSHPEPGIKPKQYFKDLREKFSAEANGIVDQICSL